MDVMLLLENESLKSVYADFKTVADVEGRGLSLHEFVSSVLRHVAAEKYHHDPLALVKHLVEIFRIIDVNGDGAMEWCEFTSFCIEAGMAAVQRVPKPAFTFQWDNRFADDVSSSSGFSLLSFCPDLNVVVVIETGSRVVRMYSPQMVPLCALDCGLACSGGEQREAEASSVARNVAYIARDRLLAVLMSNHVVLLWLLTDRDAWKLEGRLPAPPDGCLCTSILYEPYAGTLLLGCGNGTILSYDAKSRTLLHTLAEHTDVVLAIVPVPCHQGLVTSGLDGQLLLWDTNRGKLRRALRGEGAHLLRMISVDSLNLIVGINGKGELVALDLSVGEVSARACLHGPKLIDVALVPSLPPRVVTLDMDATVKVWEVSDAAIGVMPCVQTIHCPQLAGNRPQYCTLLAPQRFLRRPDAPPFLDISGNPPPPIEPLAVPAGLANVPLGPFGDLIVATNRLHRLCSVGIDTAVPPSVALYNPVTASFVTADGQDVSVWDADTGARTATFVDAGPADISCACFDDRQRKLFLGMTRGLAHCLNLQNGSLMKAGEGHTATVSAVLYAVVDRCLVSTSWDGSLAVWDDEPQEALEPLRLIARAHEVDITALAYSFELSLVVTGDRNGVVKAWDFQDLKLLAYLTQHRAVVTAAATMRHLPLFTTADAEGVVIIWTARGALHPFNAVYTFRNTAVLRELVDVGGGEARRRSISLVATAAAELVPHSSDADDDAANTGVASSQASSPCNTFLTAAPMGVGDDGRSGGAAVGSAGSAAGGSPQDDAGASARGRALNASIEAQQPVSMPSPQSRKSRSSSSVSPAPVDRSPGRHAWLDAPPLQSSTGFSVPEAEEQLRHKEALSAFVEQVLEERALAKAVSDGSYDQQIASQAAKRRTRAAVAQAGANDTAAEAAMARERIQAIKLRLEVREKVVEVACSVLQVVIPEFDDAAARQAAERADPDLNMSSATAAQASSSANSPTFATPRTEESPLSPFQETVYLAIGDDAGRVRLLDISRVVARIQVSPVPLPRRPSSQSSYNSRRRTHRSEPGPVVTDDSWFYSDEEITTSENVDTELLIDMQNYLARQLREREEEAAKKQAAATAAAATATATVGSSAAASWPPEGRHRGSSSPAADKGAGKAGGTLSAMPAVDAAATAATQQQQLLRRQRSLLQSKSALPDTRYGMTVPLGGGIGVGMEAAARSRSAVTAGVMRRASIKAGVADAVSDAAMELLRTRVNARAFGDNLPLVTQSQLAGPGTADPREVQIASMERARRKRLLPIPILPRKDTDVVEINTWSAHSGAVTSLSLFAARHVRIIADEAIATARSTQSSPRDAFRRPVLSAAATAAAGGSDAAIIAATMDAHTGLVADGDDTALEESAVAAAAATRVLQGYFFTTCGADSRVLVWNAVAGTMVGQLGRTNVDEDAILDGKARPVPWQFPPCKAARDVHSNIVAGKVLEDVRASLAAQDEAGIESPFYDCFSTGLGGRRRRSRTASICSQASRRGSVASTAAAAAAAATAAAAALLPDGDEGEEAGGDEVGSDGGDSDSRRVDVVEDAAAEAPRSQGSSSTVDCSRSPPLLTGVSAVPETLQPLLELDPLQESATLRLQQRRGSVRRASVSSVTFGETQVETYCTSTGIMTASRLGGRQALDEAALEEALRMQAEQRLVERGRLLRDIRLLEAVSKPAALAAIRALVQDVGRLQRAGMGPEELGSVVGGMLGASGDDGGAVFPGRSAEEGAAEVSAYGEGMMTPDEVARLDDVGAISAAQLYDDSDAIKQHDDGARAATAPGGPSSHLLRKAPPSGSHSGTAGGVGGQGDAASTFDFVLSAKSPATVAASALGPAAVAVLGLSGYSTGGLAAERAMRAVKQSLGTLKAAHIVASERKILMGSTRMTATPRRLLNQPAAGACPSSRPASPPSCASGGGGSAGDASGADRGAASGSGGGLGQQVTAEFRASHNSVTEEDASALVSGASMSSAVLAARTIKVIEGATQTGASTALRGGRQAAGIIRILDSKTAVTLVEAMGGLKPLVAKNISKIAQSYTAFSHEKGREAVMRGAAAGAVVKEPQTAAATEPAALPEAVGVRARDIAESQSRQRSRRASQMVRQLQAGVVPSPASSALQGGTTQGLGFSLTSTAPETAAMIATIVPQNSAAAAAPGSHTPAGSTGGTATSPQSCSHRGSPPSLDTPISNGYVAKRRASIITVDVTAGATLNCSSYSLRPDKRAASVPPVPGRSGWAGSENALFQGRQPTASSGQVTPSAAATAGRLAPPCSPTRAPPAPLALPRVPSMTTGAKMVEPTSSVMKAEAGPSYFSSSLLPPLRSTSRVSRSSRNSSIGDASASNTPTPARPSVHPVSIQQVGSAVAKGSEVLDWILHGGKASPGGAHTDLSAERLSFGSGTGSEDDTKPTLDWAAMRREIATPSIGHRIAHGANRSAGRRVSTGSAASFTRGASCLRLPAVTSKGIRSAASSRSSEPGNTTVDAFGVAERCSAAARTPVAPPRARFGAYRSAPVVAVRELWYSCCVEGEQAARTDALLAKPYWASNYTAECVEHIRSRLICGAQLPHSVSLQMLLGAVFPLADGLTLRNMVMLTSPTAAVERSARVAMAAGSGPPPSATTPSSILIDNLKAEINAVFEVLDEDGDGADTIMIQDVFHVLERSRHVAAVTAAAPLASSPGRPSRSTSVGRSSNPPISSAPAGTGEAWVLSTLMHLLAQLDALCSSQSSQPEVMDRDALIALLQELYYQQQQQQQQTAALVATAL